MNARAKKWIKFTMRWGIAVGGIAWVVANISLHDRVLIVDASNNQPVPAVLSDDQPEDAQNYTIVDPATGQPRQVSFHEVLTRPDVTHVKVQRPGHARPEKVKLLAIRAPLHVSREYVPDKLLIENPDTKQGEWVDPPSDYVVRVPYPRVERGVETMIRQADPGLLWIAVLIFPMTFAVTSLRWHALLKGLEIRISLGRAFVLNMVGAFYNTFMPGSTGGDLLKAYYASKFTPHRTRAVMSVLIDRLIGLLALVILGGSMATYQWDNPSCRHVAIVSAALLAGVALGLSVLYTPVLRRVTGLDFVLARLPMQKQVQGALISMEMYRKRPVLILWAILITFPVHITVILSAACAGKAFGLPLGFMYYWVVVPVVVLVGSMPISPQGAGVMEFFAVQLTRNQGATVADALALTMSIRLVQMFWNLFGGIFVFKGSYHVPTASEQATMNEERGQGSGVRGQEKTDSPILYLTPDP